ncbi:MAG: hypothetical protein GW833_00385, partial [Desulfuromonadales bacterium]|nr:hypothetical protein [Desulfuromonadales bacterium]
MRYAKFLLTLLLIFPATVVTGQPGKDNVNPHGDIKWDCGVCHNTGSWAIKSDQSGFNHDETGFGLVGSHRFARCAACHKDLKLFNVGSACADCHTDMHQGQLGNNCDNCHTPNSWENRKDVFEIHSRRGFPLVGVHSIADCGACHINQEHNEFTGVPTDCNGCHQEDFQAAADPNHMRAGFSSQCQSCHLPIATSWVKTMYQHTSLFILRASHLNLECSNCHATLYKGTSAECAECHLDDYQGAEDPSHTAAGFPTDCVICHDETQWVVATFDHLQSSGYELRGAHQFISCNTCHINNQYSNLPQECFGCHQTDYNESSDPNHKQGNYPQDCVMCHNENAWRPSSFDHSSTGFPLIGAHLAVPCTDCHINNQYAGTPNDCYSCHVSDYNSVSDPNHVQNNFSHTCTQCH